MLRSLEQKLDGKIGIFGRFAVQNTMPDMFVWLEHRSDAITSNFAARVFEHMSSLERENRRRIGVPERTTVLKRVFSTRNRTEIPIPASICCSDEPILRYSRNQSLFPAYLLQFTI